jgi:transketolase
MTPRDLRILILRAASTAGEGHIASAFSILDILWVLYGQVLRHDPRRPDDESRDRFVLSKGHASLGLYAILGAHGYFPLDELPSFASKASRFGGHPDCLKVPGVEASTGSLGHGMPMAVGRALALKAKKSDSRVFCLIGDGECNEGTIWESALLAAHHQLSRLICIVDFNHSGDRALGLGDLEAKFRSFGWNVMVVDGHDHAQLEKALKIVSEKKPTVLIANTTKGKGCKEMEGNPAWHHKAPTKEELENLLLQVT